MCTLSRLQFLKMYVMIVEHLYLICPKCKSKNITRIRRVSGYLEILDGFTKGKKV